MDSVKTLIAKHSDRYEEFDYYLGIIEKAEKNVINYPDISIESCKSLIEGLSKSILKNLDASYDSKITDAKEFSPLLKEAIARLSEHDEALEADFTNRCGSFLHYIGHLRNTRGDISHGRHAPKDLSSDVRLSRLVLHITEGLVYYLLTVFYSIDLSYKEVVLYEDNQAFNDMLDTTYVLDGVVKYSKALYEQDNDSYNEQLIDWIDREAEIEA